MLLRRWAHLEREERRLVKDLLALNRRLAKAYLLKEQLAHLWDYPYEGAAPAGYDFLLLVLRMILRNRAGLTIRTPR